jgi:2-iminoacetate synthase
MIRENPITNEEQIIDGRTQKKSSEPVWKDWDASFDLKTVGKREQRKARLPLPSESDLSKSYVKC